MRFNYVELFGVLYEQKWYVKKQITSGGTFYVESVCTTEEAARQEAAKYHHLSDVQITEQLERVAHHYAQQPVCETLLKEIHVKTR